MRKKIIDLRSDTVTKPSQGMLKSMMTAEVGDDVFGEDPTVKLLEETLADMTGMESAVFAASGTQSNLMGLMAHCGRGDEYIVGQAAHNYMWEGGGAAVLGSIQPQPMDFNNDGTLDLKKVASLVKIEDDHYARTRLLCLENTTGGKVLPLDYLSKIPHFCKEYNLSSHLDGARVFNAAVKLNVPLKTITQYFDSVSICFSKGLGTPMGSVLCGSKTFIKEARHWRKMLGGGMRQIGIMAAAGLYALENNVTRLADDHDNAAVLTDALTQLNGVSVISSNTNILWLEVGEFYFKLYDYLLTRGIRFPEKIQQVELSEKDKCKKYKLRLVTHLDVSRADIDFILEEINNFMLKHAK
jgi:threonine aldolase